ncbi:MAG: DoxX family protein [Propionibacteriaceae bacterium]|nr:DoxX family protein [Propionibacteriaceae bacterium]
MSIDDVTPTRFQKVASVISVIARLILGGALLVAGCLKITDLHQSVLAVHAYDFPISASMESLLGYSLPVVEILLGLIIVAGLVTRWSGLIGGLCMIAYIGVIISAWARGLTIDCGCFTPGGILDASQKTKYLEDILRDTGLLVCAAWLVVFPASRFSVDAWLQSSHPEER